VNKDYYSLRSAEVNFSSYRPQKYFINFLKKINKDSRILDFGCGYGRDIKFLISLGFKNVFGLEIDDKARNESSKLTKIFTHLDLNELDEGFDLVIMSHVLEHIPKDEIIETLIQIRNAIKEDGSLILMVPNAQSNTGAYWAYEDFTHNTLFTSGSLKYVLLAAGFRNIEFIDPKCLDSLPIYKKILRGLFLSLYEFKLNFWNAITSSNFHKGSPRIFSYEIKAVAKKSESLS